MFTAKRMGLAVALVSVTLFSNLSVAKSSLTVGWLSIMSTPYTANYFPNNFSPRPSSGMTLLIDFSLFSNLKITAGVQSHSRAYVDDLGVNTSYSATRFPVSLNYDVFKNSGLKLTAGLGVYFDKAYGLLNTNGTTADFRTKTLGQDENGMLTNLIASVALDSKGDYWFVFGPRYSFSSFSIVSGTNSSNFNSYVLTFSDVTWMAGLNFSI